LPSSLSSRCGSLRKVSANSAVFVRLRQYRAAIAQFGFAVILVTTVSFAQQGLPTASVGAAHPQVTPPPPNYTFPDGQAYVYGAEWHFLTAGTGIVRMEAAGKERKITATGESQGLVNAIFPVHDRFEVRFDPGTFCTRSMFKHSEEGSRKHDLSVQFDQAHKKSVADDKNLKTGESRHFEDDLPGCTTDIVTGFFYLQSMPLQVDSVYEFPISDGEITVVRAKVEKREQIKVPAGTFPAVLVTAEAISGTLQRKGKFSIWYSDDAHHIPLQMRSKLGWGSVLFRLQRIQR
jgi:Protein of unknown function (DUF3108)